MIGLLEIHFKDGSIKKIKNTLCNRFAYSSNNLVLGATNNTIDCGNTFNPDTTISLILANVLQTNENTASLLFTAQFPDPNLFADYTNIGIYDIDLQEWMSYVTPDFALENIDHINYYIHVPYNTSNLFFKKLLQLWKKDVSFKLINLYDNVNPLPFSKNIKLWNVLDTTYIKNFSLDPAKKYLYTFLTPDFSDTSDINGILFLTDGSITIVQAKPLVPMTTPNYFLTKFIPTHYDDFSDFTTLNPQKNYKNTTLTGTIENNIYSLTSPINNLSHFILIARILSPYDEATLPDSSTKLIYFIKPYNHVWGNDNTKDIIITDIQLVTSPPTTIQKWYQQNKRQWLDGTALYCSHPLWNEIIYEHENLKFATLSNDGLFIVYTDNSYEVLNYYFDMSPFVIDGTVEGTIVGVEEEYIFSESDNSFYVYKWYYDWNANHIVIQLITSVSKDYGELLNEPFKVIHTKDYDGTTIVYLFNNNRELYKLDTSTNIWTALPYYLTENTYPYISEKVFAFFNSSSTNTTAIHSFIVFFDTYPEIEQVFSTDYTPTIPPYINEIYTNNYNYIVTFYNENEQKLYLLAFNNINSSSEQWVKTYDITDKIIFYPVPTQTIPLLLPTSSGLFYIFAPAFTSYLKDSWQAVIKDSSIFWDNSPNIPDYYNTFDPPLPEDENSVISYYDNYFINNDMFFYILTKPDQIIYTDISQPFDIYSLFSIGTRQKEDFYDFQVTTDSTIPHSNININIFKVEIRIGELDKTPSVYYYSSKDPPPTRNPNSFYVQIIPPFHILYNDENNNFIDYSDTITLSVYWLIRGRADENLIGNNIFPVYSEPNKTIKFDLVFTLDSLFFVNNLATVNYKYAYFFVNNLATVNYKYAYFFVN